jgi:hypothetical protein
MRPRALLFLALVVALLAGFIFFYEGKRPPAEERARLAKRVFAMEASAVRSLRIERAGKLVRLERVGAPKSSDKAGAESEWRLLEPVADRADRWLVQKLLDSLTSLEKQRDLPDVDPVSLGLDRPRAVVTLTTDAGERALEVGAELPVGGTMAVAIRGQKRGAVIANTIFAELTADAASWRSREVLTAERDRIVRLSLVPRDGAPPIVLSRAKAGDVFRLEAPFTDRADREKVDALISDLTSLRVKDFLDSPGGLEQSKLAAGPGAIEIGVEGAAAPQGGKRLEIGEAIAGPDPTVSGSGAGEGQPATRVLRVGERTFTAETRLGETLRREAAGWRSPAWSAAEVYRVEGLQVRGLGEAVDLRRVGGEWQRGEDKIDGAAASDLLYAVTGARAEATLDRAQAEARGAVLGEPRLTLVLKLDQGSEETLRAFGPLAGGLTPVTASDREAVLLLPASALREIESKLAAVRQAKAAATP